MKRLPVFSLLAIAIVAFSLSGCKPAATEDGNKPAAGPSEGTNKSQSAANQTAAEMEKAKAELAKLSPEDAASATKQNICPVSDELLGSMGPPKQVDVNGQQVWICCEGCRKELLANPDKYLAKLK